MKSLNRALDLIELIAERGAIGVRELSGLAGLPPATTHRMVAALQKRGYLFKTGRSHRYALSPKFLKLGESAQQQIDIVASARPFLEKLMADTRENANLCVRDGHKVIYVDHVGSPDHNLQAFTRLGGSAPLYASGVGKLFLSDLGERQFQAYLKAVDLRAYTPHTLTTAKALGAEIKKVGQNGYAIDDEERELGIRCVAAPVLNHGNEIVAAISVSGAVQRLTDERLPTLAKLLVDTAHQLSTAIGYH